MKNISVLILLFSITISSQLFAQAKIMNPGVAVGQLVILTLEDVVKETAKFKSLNPLSIPVFTELPMDMSVTAGAITLKQQNLLSHVQLKSRARKTPNLDISTLKGGLSNPLLNSFKEGDWISMSLKVTGEIEIKSSTQEAAATFYNNKKTAPIKLLADLNVSTVFETKDLSWTDFNKVGSKAANYAELAKALNSEEREVVRNGYALPFYYYQQFIDANPKIKAAILNASRDPLMRKIEQVDYRSAKLTALQNMILAEDNIVDQNLIDQLISIFDNLRTADNLPLKMKLRSSTNSEDLPNFNGAGLYSSEAYKPAKDGVEKSKADKEKSLKNALRTVWASIWNLRAFDERNFFSIPHLDVKMGIQINPSYVDEFVDGVVVTKNILQDPKLPGKGVYIEAQRGSTFSVANPDSGVKPTKILVLVDPKNPLNKAAYRVHTLQKSNIANDTETILPTENPTAMMTDEEIKDLAYQCLKAEAYFKPLLGKTKNDFSLDLEFKVSSVEKGPRAVYLKQARPYLN